MRLPIIPKKTVQLKSFAIVESPLDSGVIAPGRPPPRHRLPLHPLMFSSRSLTVANLPSIDFFRYPLLDDRDQFPIFVGMSFGKITEALSVSLPRAATESPAG